MLTYLFSGYLSLLGLFLILFVVTSIVVIALCDCDVTLRIHEVWGKTPAQTLRGRVVWITGASSGIGEKLALELARAGAKLVLSARREQLLDDVRNRCLAVGGSTKPADVLALPLDMLDHDSHHEAVRRVLEKFSKIDVLVNNAGRSQRSWVADTSVAVYRGLFELNVTAALSLANQVLPHMLERRSGLLYFTSSIAGKIGAPFSAGYSASKFALHGWCDAARIELAVHNVDVGLACPGPVDSDVTLYAFTSRPERAHGKPRNRKEKTQTGERCARLMAIAIANRLPEVWIAVQPILLFTYLLQYAPTMGKAVAQRIGLKQVIQLRTLDTDD